MRSLMKFIGGRIPHPAVKAMADRLFIITLSGLTLSGYLLGIEEGFICGITALILYMSNIEIGCSRGLAQRKGGFMMLSLISVSLAALKGPYLPLLSLLYTFFLVYTERDDYYRGVPMFLTPLAIHLLSMGISPEKVPGRIFSIFVGVLIAFTSQKVLWPVERREVARQEAGRAIRFRYALRMSLGVGAGLMLGRYMGRSLEAWMAYTFIILHLPIDDEILPKVMKRVGGTVLGGVLYFLMAYRIDSKLIAYLLAAVALYLAFLFMRSCYLTAVTFITLNFFFYSAGMAPFGFLIKQRILLALLGGGIAVAVSVLLPMKEAEKSCS
ncbi:hypothetical protein PM10SUCC1_25260 [Propionigenium maris DSM 9537]|uniref:Integral membrane bound transporter domain-containing protein n=1 Tax=Propionigenium maris DSM 9537 TaxID=1123000 RepID=A0A9W6GNW5_9FUSO|nr:FUSC family protein [Propionigenium maris]GLI57012.1 hypothetical protein PM10SUCC1_25260 [Propionigenium maris DSM 9537]